MPDYKFVYRCRYCKQEFCNSITGNAGIAFGVIANIAADIPIKQKEAATVGKTTMHIEKDHYGIADLIGCEIIGGEES